MLAALDTVRDPELDEPVTELGFVSSCTVSADGDVQVRLRLPTYFCAPNFAFLMVADAYDAVSRRRRASAGREVVLDDHFASDAINGGVAARSGFVESFAGLADGRAGRAPHRLRAQGRAGRRPTGSAGHCWPQGGRMDELAGLTLGDVPPSPDLDRLRARRAELGLPAGDDSALLVDAITGEAVGVEALPLHLRRARLTRVNTGGERQRLPRHAAHRYATRGEGELEEIP